MPAYNELLGFNFARLIPHADHEYAAHDPTATAFYARGAQSTTTDVTPSGSIQLGLQEVARNPGRDRKDNA